MDIPTIFVFIRVFTIEKWFSSHTWTYKIAHFYTGGYTEF